VSWRLPPPVGQDDERKPLWRILSDRGGDAFADWVCDVATKRLDPMALIAACATVVEINDDYGSDARRAAAELCLPDVWDEEQFKITDFYRRRRK